MSANWRGMLAIGAMLLGLGGGVATRSAAQPPDDPLFGLGLADGRLEWDGIRLGMSLVAAERRMGATLALDRNAEGNCPAFLATADRNGITLTLGFPAAKPSAKVEWIRVRFRGSQLMFSGPELADALRRKFPGARWVERVAGLAEEDDLMPTYAIDGKEPQAVRLAPRDWMVLTRASCLD
jgi:hypothetical protein